MSLPGRWQGNEHIAAKSPRTALWGYLLLAFAAGVALPFQAGANAELADWVHSPIRAAFVSFLVGTLALLVIAALVFKPLPSWTRLGDAPGGSGSAAGSAPCTCPPRSSPRRGSGPPV